MANIATLMMSPRATPAYVSYAGQGAARGGGSSLSPIVSAPSGGLAGDFLVSFACANGDATWSSGFASHTDRATQTTEASLSVRTRSDTDGASGGTTATSTTSATLGALYQLRFRSALYDTVGTIGTTTSNGTFTVGGITSAGGLAVLIIVGRSTITCTTPSGWTELFNENGNNMRVAAFTKAVQAGATGSVDTTIGSVAGTVCGVIIGLR